MFFSNKLFFSDHLIPCFIFKNIVLIHVIYFHFNFFYPKLLISQSKFYMYETSGRVAQSVGHPTHKSGVLGSITGLATYFFSPSAFSRRAVVSYWRKYVHEVLVNRLGGLSLPRKSVVRLTDRPDMISDVYRGRKTTNQQSTTCMRLENLL